MFRMIARAALVLPMLPAALVADVVRLKSGGEVRGSVVDADETADSETVTVETLSGGTISVRKTDVEFITRRPRVVEEYERKAQNAANTVEAQWELAEWCRLNDLDERRREHLERIVEVEFDHAEARQALGQIQHDGQWMTREEVMRDRGLVPYKGRWITPQELELIEKTAAERDREQRWFTEVRKLKAWLRGNSDDLRRQSIATLRALRDPDAVPALAKFFGDDPDPAVRSLYVSVLAAMPGDKPVEPLVTQSLHDVDADVRREALAAIGETRSDAALPYFLKGLQHERNEVVRRAGLGLEKVGDERAVPDLMKALITTHRYRIQVPDNTPTYAFARNGAFGPGGTPLTPEIEMAMRTGALPYGVNVVDLTQPRRTRMVTVSVNQENAEVLTALQAITGETFGFDERTWRLWWAAKKNGIG
ncbi:MAG: HEAT repeat domain-containing protein [Planctomycetaceae bacterium]